MPSLYSSCPPYHSSNARASATQPQLCAPRLSSFSRLMNGFFNSSIPSAASPVIPVGSNSRGFFSNSGAVVATFIMVIIESGLVIVLLYSCLRQYKRKKQQIRARNMRISQPYSDETPILMDPLPFPDASKSITVVSRQNSWKKHPYAASVDDEYEVGHTVNMLPTQGYNVWRGDSWGDSLYEPANPRSVGINRGITATCSDRDLEDPLVHRQYQPKAQRIPNGTSIPHTHHPLVITPSRAYLPFPDWRCTSETASPTSVYPATLSVEADDEPDHRLPTPTSIARPKAAACPNQSYSWGASTNGSRSYRTFVESDIYTIIPSNPGNNRDSRTAAPRYPPSDGTRQSSPPPVPPKSPLRKPMSLLTLPNVRKSGAE